MRLARFLLACTAVSVLAACGSDTITAPEKSQAPRFDIQYGSGQSACNGTLSTVVADDGSVTEVCVTRQYGSGQ